MAGIYAKVIEDSISNDGIRITTIECRFPRICLAENNTHRVFSRNSASSRAIPIQKLIKSIKDDMYVPIFWGKNQAGMQANEELTGFKRWLAEKVWRFAGMRACDIAYLLYKIGLHKQHANRIIENFGYVTVCITSTYWNNFFALRNHKDALPEIKELAQQIYDAREASTPRKLKFGEWHLPYTDDNEKYWLKLKQEDLKQISVARCASTSYKTVDGKPMYIEKAKQLYDKLVGAVPLHASPLEHQATPDRKIKGKWEHPELHGNFYGWIQNRKTFEKEFIDEYKE